MTTMEVAKTIASVNTSSSPHSTRAPARARPIRRRLGPALLHDKQSVTTALDLAALPEVLQLLGQELGARRLDAIDDFFLDGDDDEVCAVVQRHAERILNALDAITTPSM